MNDWEYLARTIASLHAHANRVRDEIETLYHTKLFREESNRALIEELGSAAAAILSAGAFLPSMSQADLDEHRRMMGEYFLNRGELRGQSTPADGMTFLKIEIPIDTDET